MIPVHQKRHNDCVRAAVASLLEMSLEDVPDFNPISWGEELWEWLGKQGLAAINITVPSELEGHPLGLTLAAIPAGPPFPDDWKHCVICKDGAVHFDPKRGFINNGPRADEYTIIYPLNPSVLT